MQAVKHATSIKCGALTTEEHGSNRDYIIRNYTEDPRNWGPSECQILQKKWNFLPARQQNLTEGRGRIQVIRKRISDTLEIESRSYKKTRPKNIFSSRRKVDVKKKIFFEKIKKSRKNVFFENLRFRNFPWTRWQVFRATRTIHSVFLIGICSESIRITNYNCAV